MQNGLPSFPVGNAEHVLHYYCRLQEVLVMFNATQTVGSLLRVPKRQSTVVHKLAEEQTVLVDEEGSHLFLLNEMGTIVWHLMDGHRNVIDIVKEIVSVLSVSEEQVSRDVQEFLGQLEEKRLVSLD